MKLKTSKSASKRFKISSRGKIQRRRAGINHFNAKGSGKNRRHNRGSRALAKVDSNDIQNLLPYDMTTM